MENNFKDVSSLNITYIKPSHMDVNGSVTGTFVETYDSEYGPNHKFTDDKGETFVINGTGKLNYLMAKVAPGSLTKVVYLGKQILKEGRQQGKAAHDFKVLVASKSDEAAPAPAPAKPTKSVRDLANEILGA